MCDVTPERRDRDLFGRLEQAALLRFSPEWIGWIFKVAVVSRCGCFIEVRTACQPYKDRNCVDHMLDGKPLLGFLWVSSVYLHEETIVHHIEELERLVVAILGTVVPR